jgi:hypothetical protein
MTTTIKILTLFITSHFKLLFSKIIKKGITHANAIPPKLPLLHLKIGFYNGKKVAGDIFLWKV